MPSQSPALPRVYAESPQFKSRLYVQLFSWFGVLIAVLHLFEGRSLGVVQLILSLIGIYASWDDVSSRRSFVTTYMLGCFVWVIFDFFFTFLLITACNETLKNLVLSLLVSNTFPNLAPSLETLLSALAKDAQFFSIFSAVISVFFNTMAAYWAFALHYDVLNMVANSDVRIPLLRPSSNAPRSGVSGVAGFGTISRNPQPTATSPRSVNPFAGRGYRLGFGETS